MRLVALSCLLMGAATQAMACFSPTRPTEGYPLKLLPNCAFEEAGSEGLTWYAKPAYRLSNGLVAQTISGFDYCYSRMFLGTMIADCETGQSTLFSNWDAKEFVATPSQPGPSLPSDLGLDHETDFAGILAHDRVEHRDVTALWAEPGTGVHPDPLCGCNDPALPMNEKG